MGTLGGFPTPPALWLRRAKPAFAYAIMGTLGGFAPPFGPTPASPTPLASPFGDFGTCTFPTTPARSARALALGLANPSRDGRARSARGAGVGRVGPSPRRGALAPGRQAVGEARLRLRDHENPSEGPSQPTPALPCLRAGRNLARRLPRGLIPASAPGPPGCA